MRMLQFLLFSFIVTFAISCGGSRYIDYFPYYDDGIAKPRIALVQVKDSSQSGLPWDLSAEFSNELYLELMNSGQLYVLSLPELGPVGAQCGEIDFFGPSAGFAAEFCSADFLVALELIEHALIPDPLHSICYSNPQVPPRNCLLKMKMRVRIIDLRCGRPKDILYEIAKTDYLIAAPYDALDYEKYGWGWERYSKTPYGIAHQRMIRNLTSRFEQVIWSAK